MGSPFEEPEKSASAPNLSDTPRREPLASPPDKSSIGVEDFCTILLAYFDETRGHEILVSYPDPDLVCDEECLRPIHIHSIWFLSAEEQSAIDHVDLDYRGRTYFAKKFTAPSFRKKTRAGVEDTDDEVMVLFVSLPEELNIFGSRILQALFNAIKKTIRDELCSIIIGHIAQKKIIKSQKIRSAIDEGERVAERFRRLCEWVLARFTPDLLDGYMNTVKKQKALAYLLLKDLDQKKPVEGIDADISYADIFEPIQEHQQDFNPLKCIAFSSLEIRDDEMLEITLVNNSGRDLDDVSISVSHVQEFFERNYFEQEVDFWWEGEEIMVQFPLIKTINDYIIQVEMGSKKLVNRKFSLRDIKRGKVEI